jgi:hypothetical protein
MLGKSGAAAGCTCGELTMIATYASANKIGKPPQNDISQLWYDYCKNHVIHQRIVGNSMGNLQIGNLASQEIDQFMHPSI